MRSVFVRSALCALAVTMAAGCDDVGTGVGRGEDGGGGGRLMAPASMNRFEVDLRASGPFRPGQPIQITLTGRANLQTRDAAVQITLPEVAAARAGGWERLDYGEDGSVDPELVERQAMGRGQSITRTATVTIPRPGYYRVVASVYRASDDTADERPARGELVQEVAHREIWLWIAESGGRATAAFEPERIPETMHRVPGPLTPTTAPPPGSRPGTRDVPRPQHAAPDGPRLAHAGYAGWVDLHAMYYNRDVKNPSDARGTLRPIPNARYEYLIYSRTGAYVRTHNGTTGADGLTYVQCYSDANGHGRYRLRVFLDNDRIAMEVPLVIDTQLRDFATTCGLAGNEPAVAGSLPDERSHVYQNLDRAIRNGDAFFGRQRGRITVALSSTHSYSTYEWHSATRRVVIATNPAAGYGDQIWGTFGAFVQAHEYGHAYHNDVLGGVERYYYVNGQPVCPAYHYMQDPSNLQCALAEGFADYYAVATLGTATGQVQLDMESGRYSPSATNQWGHRPGVNGSLIQGAVASFFYDITDPANEPHDQTQYPGSYVADVVRTCQVLSGSWRMHDGVDHLAYCFLGTIYDTEHFRARAAPSNISSSATHPEAYETRFWKIRRNYMKNLFGYDV